MFAHLVRQFVTMLVVVSVLLVTSAHLPHVAVAGAGASPGHVAQGHGHHSEIELPASDAGVVPAEADCHLLSLLPPARSSALDAPQFDAWPGYSAATAFSRQPQAQVPPGQDCSSGSDLQALLQRFIL